MDDLFEMLFGWIFNLLGALAIALFGVFLGWMVYKVVHYVKEHIDLSNLREKVREALLKIPKEKMEKILAKRKKASEEKRKKKIKEAMAQTLTAIVKDREMVNDEGILIVNVEDAVQIKIHAPSISEDIRPGHKLQYQITGR